MHAGMQKAPATTQPSSRGPRSDRGTVTATGSTKSRRAAVEAVAAWGVTIPANSTTKPTTAMATTEATLSVENNVPMMMNPTPTTHRPA